LEWSYYEIKSQEEICFIRGLKEPAGHDPSNRENCSATEDV
jgi:hypothetical protein